MTARFTTRDWCILGALFVLPACAAPAPYPIAPSIADDSAVYVTLIAPDSQGGRGRAVATPIDLRRMTDGARIGGALARRAPGFDSALVTALHRTAPNGRGPGVALHSRPTLLWRKARNSSTARATPSGNTVTEMERYETGPEWISLQYSAVQYSPDGRWAVVLENRFCGPLCGAERYVVLRRAVGGWRVVTELVTVVS